MGRLEEEVVKLRQELTKKEKEFAEKKQRYERVITQLQTDNAKLRKLISEGDILGEGTSSIGGENTQKIEKEGQAEGKTAEALRNQLKTMARAYEAQVQEITAYFAAIKERHGEFLMRQGTVDIRKTVGAIDRLVEEWKAERQQFENVIIQLNSHLTKQKEREEKLENEMRQKNIDLQIAKSQLAILKRARNKVRDYK